MSDHRERDVAEAIVAVAAGLLGEHKDAENERLREEKVKAERERDREIKITQDAMKALADLRCPDCGGSGMQIACMMAGAPTILEPCGCVLEARTRADKAEHEWDEAHEAGRAHQAVLEVQARDRFLKTVPHDMREAGKKIRAERDRADRMARRVKMLERALEAERTLSAVRIATITRLEAVVDPLRERIHEAGRTVYMLEGKLKEASDE